ncbi:MAG: metal ABC transporter permease [Aquificota bacterium]|nr:metal ABC transporter permease [Aquificota bacterium]
MMEILGPPLLLSLFLLLALYPFGREIVRRGIIFVDLTVAQFSALGVSLSVVLGFEGATLYLSLASSVLCGALIGVGVHRIKHREAFVGVLYAFGWSLSLLLLSKHPRGAEEFMKVMASDVLFSGWMDVLTAGILSLIVNLLFRYIKGHGRAS